MKPWFVVGGAGFIGTNLAKRRDCTVFDLNLQRVHHERAAWYADALDIADLCQAMDEHKPETVVHLAANADISTGFDNPGPDLDGITITRNVCEAARATGVKRIIYTSGSGVYGKASPDFPTERTACFPTSAYGASKLASEAILHAYEAYGIEVVIFRPANVVGPDQTHGVGYDFMRKLREDPTHLEILGDGKQSKGYLHVDDLLDAFEVAPPGTWNIAPHDTLTVTEIAEMASEALGVSPEFSYTGGLAWPGDIPVVRMSSAALRWETNWTSRDSRQAMAEALSVL